MACGLKAAAAARATVFALWLGWIGVAAERTVFDAVKDLLNLVAGDGGSVDAHLAVAAALLELLGAVDRCLRGRRPGGKLRQGLGLFGFDVVAFAAHTGYYAVGRLGICGIARFERVTELPATDAVDR